MQITDVKIHLIPPRSGLIGFAELTLAGSLHLSGIGIYERLDTSGYRLTYPTKQAGSHDINLFHPLTPALSQQIEQAIIEALKAVNQRNNDRHYRAHA